jgi:cysteine desulfurase
MITEHPCVMSVCHELVNRGFNVTFLKPQSNGILNLEDLKNAITDKTFLVSIMSVHNEIGIIQPIEEIGKITRAKGIIFHTDAAQAFGKIPLDVEKMNIDMMSISGHKIYAPKGIGALYVRKKPRVRIRPIIYGGGQERGMRGGTLPTALIVGLGLASEIAKRDMEKNYQHIKRLSDHFLNRIFTETSYIFLNGDRHQRFPGCLNISFPGIEGESLLMSLKGVALSTGSACSSAKLESSPVIKSLGVDELMSHSNLRFGIGKYSTKDEIDLVVDNLVKSVKKLRDMSPVWEDIEEKLDLKK